MKTSTKIMLVGIVLLIATYFGVKYFGIYGIVPSLLGIFGITKKRTEDKLIKLELLKELEEANLKEIEKKREELKKNGVKDLKPEDEVEYWKNQD